MKKIDKIIYFYFYMFNSLICDISYNHQFNNYLFHLFIKNNEIIFFKVEIFCLPLLKNSFYFTNEEKIFDYFLYFIFYLILNFLF